jgi:hypothetical protein
MVGEVGGMFNSIDSTIANNYELDENTRIVQPPEGVIDRPYTNGILGSYFFKLPVNTPKGYFTNAMHSISFTDENGKGFSSSTGTNTPTMIVDNQQVYIIPEPTKLGILASLLAYFRKRK